MGYGAVLGQTPILTAEGIEYDNSATSGIITGNNVQQAIDQSVNKIKQNENKIQQVENQIGNVENNIQGMSTWELLFNKNIVQSYTAPSIPSSHIVLEKGIMQNIKKEQYLSVLVQATGTMNVSTLYSKQSSSVFLGRKEPTGLYYKDYEFMRVSGSGSSSCDVFQEYFNFGIHSKDWPYVSFRSINFAYVDNLTVCANSSLVFDIDKNDTTRADVQLNLKIYGLKAPTF